MGHSVDPSKAKVLAMESNTFKCLVREAIEFRLCKLSLNRDNDFELASNYDTISAFSRPVMSIYPFLTFKFALCLMKFDRSERKTPLLSFLIRL